MTGKNKVSFFQEEQKDPRKTLAQDFLVAPTQSGGKCRQNFSKTSQADFYQHNLYLQTLHFDFSKDFVFSVCK